MDYKRIYEELIEHRKMLPKLEGVYYERHHILPRCMGGGDEEKNMIWLTCREHCIAHLLLAFAYGGKLWGAATAMALFVGKRKGMSTRMLAIARKEAAKAMSGDNSPVADKRIYKVKNLLTGQVTEGTRAHMNEVLGISPVRMYMLITGRVYTYENFALEETEVPGYLVKGKIHKFVDTLTGNIIQHTRKEMFEKCGMPYQASLKLLKGEFKKWKNFKCYIDEDYEGLEHEATKIYAFKRLIDDVIIYCDRDTLEKDHGVSLSKSAMLVRGKNRTSQGFEYVGAMIDGVLIEHEHPEIAYGGTKVSEEVLHWIRISDGQVFSRNRKEMAEEFGIPLSASRNFLAGNIKTVKGFYLAGRDITKDNRDNRIHRIKHIETGEVLEVTREFMLKKMGLGRSSVTNLIHNKAYNNQGYCLADAKEPPKDLWWPDKAIHCYENVLTGERVYKTRQQMVKELGFTSQQLTNLKNGHIQTSKGYKLVREEVLLGTSSTGCLTESPCFQE